MADGIPTEELGLSAKDLGVKPVEPKVKRPPVSVAPMVLPSASGVHGLQEALSLMGKPELAEKVEELPAGPEVRLDPTQPSVKPSRLEEFSPEIRTALEDGMQTGKVGEFILQHEKAEGGVNFWLVDPKNPDRRVLWTPNSDPRGEMLATPIELPPGLNLVQLRQTVERMLRYREDTTNAEVGFEDDLNRALNPYLIGTPAIPPNPAIVAEIPKFIREAEARMKMVRQIGALAGGDYEGFTKEVLDEKHIRHLWRESPHSEKIRTLVGIMEQNDGMYWRNPAGAERAAVQAQLAGWFPVLEDRKHLRELVERLMTVTEMASFYTGPVDGAGNLVDNQIMGQIDAMPGTAPMGDKKRYVQNVEYYRLWQARRDAGPLTFAVDKDPGMTLRRVAYLPEELQAKSMGKAAGLRKDQETFVRSMPQQFGYRSLSQMAEWLAPVAPAPGFIGPPMLPKSADTSEWGKGVLGSGKELRGATLALVSELIAAGHTFGDVTKLGDNLKPLAEAMGKLKGYLAATPELLEYAEGQRIKAWVDYINSNAPERAREWRDVQGVGYKFRKAIVDALGTDMSAAAKDRLLREIGASRGKLLGLKGAEAGVGFFSDILQALGKLKLFGG